MTITINYLLVGGGGGGGHNFGGGGEGGHLVKGLENWSSGDIIVEVGDGGVGHNASGADFAGTDEGGESYISINGDEAGHADGRHRFARGGGGEAGRDGGSDGGGAGDLHGSAAGMFLPSNAWHGGGGGGGEGIGNPVGDGGAGLLAPEVFQNFTFVIGDLVTGDDGTNRISGGGGAGGDEGAGGNGGSGGGGDGGEAVASAAGSPGVNGYGGGGGGGGGASGNGAVDGGTGGAGGSGVVIIWYEGAPAFGGGLFSLIIDGGDNKQYTFHVITNVGQNVLTVGAAAAAPADICFPAGTPVTTDQGRIAIEKLIPGTHTIKEKPIVGISQTKSSDDHLLCFEKHALGHNIPDQQTIVSREHCILYKGKMKRACTFMRYARIRKMKYTGDTLYNVVLEKHGSMSVNNMTVETLHPKHWVAQKISTKAFGKTFSKKV